MTRSPFPARTRTPGGLLARALAPLGLALLALLPAAARAAAPAGQMTIAAAADLHQAMPAVVAAYRHDHPEATISVVYGASGMLLTQIEQGAPFDLFFSADSDYPGKLVSDGKAGGAASVYAVGHLVLWSAGLDMHGVHLADLTQPRFGRIAIANPQHAPYGKRAEQALRGAGIWDALQSRLVYGENIGQTAQMARSGAAQVGIIALSLATDQGAKGSFVAVPDAAFQPLLQSFVLTGRGGANDLAKDFAHYMQGDAARALLARYGFTRPAGAS